MSKHGRIALMVVAWLGSIAAVGVWAQTLGRSEPKVLAGGDVGFRVDKMEGGAPSGRLVVRINGQWVEASFAAGIARIGTR